MRSSRGIVASPRLVTGARVAAMIVAMWVASIGLAAESGAKVFTSQNQALREAFPGATRIDRDSRIVTREELAQIAELTNADDLPRVVVLHTAWQGERVVGYAHIDVHNVRTKPEAFMVVLEPSGVVRSVRVLAFHEPLDYLPTDRWYAQFEGKRGADRLRVGADVHGVVGATLSTRAAAEGVRRMLAYWEVLLRPEAGGEVAAADAGSESEEADFAADADRAEEAEATP